MDRARATARAGGRTRAGARGGRAQLRVRGRRPRHDRRACVPAAESGCRAAAHRAREELVRLYGGGGVRARGTAGWGERHHRPPRPAGAGRVTWVARARARPLGRFNDQLTLHPTSPRGPALSVPVFGGVEGDVVVLPPQMTFGVTRAGAAPSRALYIRNRGARP